MVEEVAVKQAGSHVSEGTRSRQREGGMDTFCGEIEAEYKKLVLRYHTIIPCTTLPAVLLWVQGAESVYGCDRRDINSGAGWL